MHTLAFRNTEFEVIDRNGQPWLRSPQIAVALEYKRADRINEVFARNAEEFTEAMTALIDLPTKGGIQQVRIFSLRGAHLLGMLSRTEAAKEFRSWVLDVLEGLTQAPALPAPEQPAPELPPLLKQRWLTTYDSTGQQHTCLLPIDACIMNTREFIQHISEPNGIQLDTPELLQLTMQLMAKLQQRNLNFYGYAT